MQRKVSFLMRALAPAILLLLGACGLPSGMQMKNLALSPDGNLLAVSYRCGSGPMRIGLVDLSEKRKIFDVVGQDGRYADSPGFSNQGTKMVYTSGEVGKFGNGIFVLNLENFESDQVLFSKLPNGYPTFSPDDRQIAFARAGHIRPKAASNKIGAIGVFLVSLETRKIKKMTDRQYYQIAGLDFISSSQLLIGGVTGGSKYADAVIFSVDTLRADPLDLGDDVSNVQYADGINAVVYVANADITKLGPYDLEIFSWRNGEKGQLSSHYSYIREMAVSSSGNRVAYLSNKTRTREFSLYFDDLSSGVSTIVPAGILGVCDW